MLASGRGPARAGHDPGLRGVLRAPARAPQAFISKWFWPEPVDAIIGFIASWGKDTGPNFQGSSDAEIDRACRAWEIAQDDEALRGRRDQDPGSRRRDAAADPALLAVGGLGPPPPRAELAAEPSRPVSALRGGLAGRWVGSLPVRALYTLAVMWGAATVVFFALRITPGDPANFVVDPVQSAAVKDRIRHELGLDQPLADPVRPFPAQGPDIRFRRVLHQSRVDQSDRHHRNAEHAGARRLGRIDHARARHPDRGARSRPAWRSARPGDRHPRPSGDGDPELRARPLARQALRPQAQLASRRRHRGPSVPRASRRRSCDRAAGRDNPAHARVGDRAARPGLRANASREGPIANGKSSGSTSCGTRSVRSCR